jgi:hypothetical protein
MRFEPIGILDDIADAFGYKSRLRHTKTHAFRALIRESCFESLKHANDFLRVLCFIGHTRVIGFARQTFEPPTR